MKCIITGGAGFIGSNLAEKLVKMGHRVTVIDNLTTGRKKPKRNNKKIKFINHDISINNEKFKNYFNNIDWVFHLAGLADIVPSIKDPQNTLNQMFKVL